MNQPTTALSSVIASCVSDYDPNALPVDDARRIIRAYVNAIEETETLTLHAALARTLADDIISPINVPAHDNSAMDGYAVRAADLGTQGETTLRRIGEAFAGKVFHGALGPRECVRIMTGAVMPTGADTVIVQEVCREQGELVFVPAGIQPGENRRFAGEDVAAGKPILKRGDVIGAAELGLIASLGIGTVVVKRKLRVAFFSTGDELASIGQPLGEGQVYDSNRYTLFGMLSRLGVEIIDLGVVRDSPALIEQALLDAAARADAIITTGGVSVGEADFIRELLAKLGEVAFWKIAMRPGRPMAFGRIGSTRFFGLPGNPVAVMVTFYHFVRDGLLAMQGRNGVESPVSFQVASATRLRKKPGRTEYQRGVVTRGANGALTVRLTGQQGSGILRSMAEANCFIVLEHGRGDVAAGDLVTVLPFDGLE
jgi:molybdopterin molybdotransferase